jgi:mono/diheme cytochrome c family protein/cytochrome c2
MKAALTLLALLLLALAGATAFVYSGLYDISATDQHLAPTYHAIRKAMQRSVARRAADIEVPPLGSPAQLERGLSLYRAHCVQCHGAPGVAPAPFALGLTPLPTPLARSGIDRTPAELFWVVKHGIKMTGMPAWEFRMPEEDLWAVVSFVKHLPLLSVPDYKALEAPPALPRVQEPGAQPSARRGREALKQYGCVGCHEIPGLVGPEARLGPPLAGIAARTMLGGVLPNSPENMARWLRAPQAFSPHSAMPTLGVTARDARDMAAHLATLK